MSEWSELSKREKSFLAKWCAWLIVPGLIATLALGWHQHKKRDEASRRDHDRMSETSVIEGRTEPEKTPPPGHERDVPLEVRVGVYVDHISEVTVVSSVWRVDFFVWFNWTGGEEKFNPGETFKVVNGSVGSRSLLDRRDEGGKHWVLYSASATITKNFNLARFPLDRHLLTIAIEDQAKQSYAMKFVADAEGTRASSRVNVPGYVITNLATVVKPHSYASAMGAPWLPASQKATYSQFTTGITIERPSWGLFAKMFVGLYLAIAMALAGLFIRGGAERVALASTALFVAIVNALTASEHVPDTGVATLCDLVSNLGYVIIVQLVLQAVIYLRVFKDPDAPPARLFDRVTFAAVGAFSVAANMILVWPS